MQFWPIFGIFHRLRPYLCTKGTNWGSTSRPHIGDLVMSLFHFGVQRSWLGMPQKWSILDQKWPNMAGLSTLQSGPKGSERDQNGQPKCFWPLGTLLGPSGPFWTISNKNWYFAPKHLCQPLLCPFGAKKSFLSKMVQKGPDGPKMGPKWSKTFRLTILVPFGPFWTTLECWQACHVWPFLVQNGPFLGHPQSWTVDPRVKKRLIIMSPMCGLLVEPQMSPFGT